jgi:hypothetical protein
MKKVLKKYSQFINESKIEDWVIENLTSRHDFWELLMDLDYSQFNMKTSFSDMCKTDNDPDEDFKNIQSYFDSKGFTIEEIKEIFSKENNRVIGYDLHDLYRGRRGILDESPLSDIIHNVEEEKKNSNMHHMGMCDFITDPFKSGSKLDSQNATIDIYFYKLFEKLGLGSARIDLGGGTWVFWNYVDSNGEEAFIRYRYGYHNTKYGKLMLKQAGRTEEELKEDALNYLQEFISYNFDSVITNVYQNKYNIRISNMINLRLYDIKIDEFTIVENDRYIIDLVDMSDSFNSLESKESGKLGDKYKIEPDDIATEFTKILDGLGIDIVFTGNDLVIYSKFNENV